MFDKLKGLFKAKEPLELSIDKVTEFIDNQFSPELISINEKVSAETEACLGDFSGLKEAVLELKQRQDEDVFANSLKNKFCEKALSLIDGLEKPEANYKALKNFTEASGKIIDQISNIGFKEILHLRAFKEQMNKIAGKTRLIMEKNKRLDELISKALLKKLDLVGEKVTSIKKIRESAETAETELKNMEASISKLESGLKEKVLGMEEFLKDERFARLHSIKNNIEELERKKSAIKQEIATEFSGLDKTLKKFQHSGFADREAERTINSYIYDSDAFLIDNETKIKVILEKVLEKLENNELEIEEKRREKVVYLLNNFSLLAELKESYKNVVKEIAEKNRHKEELSQIYEEKAEKEMKIKTAEEILAKANEKKKALTTERDNKIKAFDAGIKNLEKMLSDLLKRGVSIQL